MPRVRRRAVDTDEHAGVVLRAAHTVDHAQHGVANGAAGVPQQAHAAMAGEQAILYGEAAGAGLLPTLQVMPVEQLFSHLKPETWYALRHRESHRARPAVIADQHIARQQEGRGAFVCPTALMHDDERSFPSVKSMRRIIVLGGYGFFGAAAVERLRADGIQPLIGSRRSEADIQIDVEDAASIRAALRPGDVVIDTVGPFQDRTTTLVEAAIALGVDVIDISDSLAYAERLYALKPIIDASGSRVLTACSSISAISAAMVRLSGIVEPERLTGFLGPATHYAASPSTGASLLRSVGREIRVWRHGRLITRVGWRESQRFPMPPPVGWIRGHLFESVDSLTLPPVWPSLSAVDFFVDSRVPGLNTLLTVAARMPPLRALIQRFLDPCLTVARALGPSSGCLAYEIVGANGQRERFALVASERGYFTPIVPAVLAARAIAEERFEPRGLVPPNLHVQPEELIAYLDTLGVRFLRPRHGGE
jgi:hypothetical protein